jgi:hypothetical protein
MSSLLPLARLIKLANENKKEGLYRLLVCFGFEHSLPDGSYTYLLEWQASVGFKTEFVTGSSASLLEKTCNDLLGVCEANGLHPPHVDFSEVDILIPNSELVEALIVKLHDLIVDASNYTMFSFDYWPDLMPDGSAWNAQVASASHWINQPIAEANGSSLYDVCALLWEILKTKGDELYPKIQTQS